MDGTLVTLRWQASPGRLTKINQQSTASPAFKGAPSVSELLLSPDGRFLYAGNRSENAILVYRLDARSGAPHLVQRIPSGEGPWSFAIDPSGRWLIVADRIAQALVSLRRDPATGRLTDTGQRAAAPQPVAVTFVTP